MHCNIRRFVFESFEYTKCPGLPLKKGKNTGNDWRINKNVDKMPAVQKKKKFCVK